MAALMFAAIIPVAIMFTGRIPATYEVVRDFQPTIAAIVAAIAATIAYRAAMAKINLDRELIEREHAKERLGLYIRLRAELISLNRDAKHTSQHLGDNLMRTKDANTSDVKWTMAFELESEYPEIDEAWAKVELMPQAAPQHIELLRKSIDRARMYQPERDDEGEAVQTVEYFLARQVCLANDRIVERTEDLKAIIGTAIQKLRPLDG
jgi:hypothetical protein